MRRLTQVSASLLAVAVLAGCAAGMAYRKGQEQSRLGDWDTAVAYYRQAVQADPDKPEYRIALERAMLSASHVHYNTARQLEEKDQLDAALLEYRKVAEFDPANRQAAEKVVQLERISGIESRPHARNQPLRRSASRPDWFRPSRC
jgi:tetratricopeptide (TPR) repeat protein